MGVVRVRVVFDKPNKIYHPGEMVAGRVELVLNSATKIRAVYLKLTGIAECKWNETERYTNRESNRRSRTIHRRSSEIYFTSEQILIGGKDKFTLPVGEHIYPFAAMLPLRIPSSFSGSHGGISYYGEAKIDIPFSFDKKERAEFTVINSLNLNLYPNLRTPYVNEKNKTFCWLCCDSGSLAIIVHLPKTGFAKSESVPITLEVDNASNVTVNAVTVYLDRTIEWTAERRHKHECFKLQTLSLNGVGAGQSRTWREYFTIPPGSFPYLDGSSIIKITHQLHIKADVSGLHTNLKTRIPITIGDIALSEDPNAQMVSPQAQTFCNNAAYNCGMRMPAGAPTNSGFLPYSTQNAQTSANYPYHNNANGAPFGERRFPSITSQPTTNYESSQNSPSAPFAYSDVGDGSTRASFESDGQLEKTPLLWSSPSAPPPS